MFLLPPKMFGSLWPRMCGLWVVFFFLDSGKFERSLLCSFVFSLTALSFTCSEKVFASGRGGGSPAVLPSLPLSAAHLAV